jgi:hypothetical protein
MWPIRREIAHYEPWIRLDFLGFSRAKRDLSMGYERKTEENFSCRFLPFAVEARERTQRFGMRKVGLLMQQAYREFWFSAMNCRRSCFSI